MFPLVLLQKNSILRLFIIFSIALCSCFFPFFCSSFPFKNSSYSEGPHIRLAVIGDVMCHKAQLKAAYEKSCQCYRFDNVFAYIKKYLSFPHLAIANLETTLPGNSHLYGGYPLFGSPDALVRALRNAGVDLLSLANNHSLDTGRLGLVRTRQVSYRLGFYHLGTYSSHNEWNRQRVLLIRKKGFRLAFLNYSYGTNGIPIPRDVRVNILNKNNLAKDLRVAYSMKPDATIVLLHFGKEYNRFPSNLQKFYVNYAFHHGADIVLGTHSHVLQPFQIQKKKDIYGRTRKRFVAYSLGNFISNQRWRYTSGGIILYFDLIKVRKEKQVRLGGIHYEPIWVYVEKKRNKKNYYVLPIKEFLGNNFLNLKLPPRDYYHMMQFYRDTKNHLRNSQKQSKRLGL